MRILEYRNAAAAVRALAERRWEDNRPVEVRAREIVDAVRSGGDAALLRYTRELDCPVIDRVGLRVSEREIEAALSSADRKFLRALRAARTNIIAFHRRQLQASWRLRRKGMQLEHRVLPLDRVGIYVPGGKASYPSTVLMNALPATIAGVPEIVMVTPAGRDGSVSSHALVAAAECGIDEVYRVGGAQAVAALAFGTETIRKVDKITGPGNAYVAAAKALVFGRVGIDMIAGPTEVVIVADESAPAEFVAADMIAQAEHDELATAVTFTTSRALAQQIELAVTQQLESAPRREIAGAALDRNGALVVVDDLEQALEFVNGFAPEHLEVMVRHPRRFASRVTHAGAVFIGPWSCEAMGDYVAGPNHTLPTMGTARFRSPLGVDDFLHHTNVIEIGRKKSARLSRHVEVLAAAEGLHGHAASARLRAGEP